MCCHLWWDSFSLDTERASRVKNSVVQNTVTAELAAPNEPKKKKQKKKKQGQGMRTSVKQKLYCLKHTILFIRDERETKINRKSCRNQQIKQKKTTSIPRDSLIKVKTHFTLGKNAVLKSLIKEQHGLRFKIKELNKKHTHVNSRLRTAHESKISNF